MNFKLNCFLPTAIGLLFSLSAADAFAAPVSPEMAAKEAADALAAHSSPSRRALAARSSLSLSYTSVAGEGNCFYVFNSSAGGYAIISADDRLPALLGFSESGHFEYDKLPCNIKWWLSQYQTEISSFLKADTPVAPARRRAASAERAPIAPMLTTTWDQTSPYNLLCPVDSRTGRTSVTGCVATAMAQVMKFHQWPVDPEGSHGGVDFNQISFDWDNMLDSYASGNYSAAQASAVATLMRSCGASVDMMYSSSASGAYSYKVPQALIQYFDYNPSMQVYMRQFYTQIQWNNIVYAELAEGRPVLYDGQSSEGGHAFVCDGYLSDDLFHFNWGWSGYQDGYFRLNALNPSAGGTGSYNGGYNSNQSIITGVKRSAGETRIQQALVASGEFVYDEKNSVFTVNNGEQGINLIYNPLGHDMKLNPGIKITSASDPDNMRYVKSPQNVSLMPMYGFTEMKFSIPSLPDGVYHVSPAFFNCYDEWQDILVPYGVQTYVTLTVAGGKNTLSNDGPDQSSFSDIIISEPELASPIYDHEGFDFRIPVNNVKNGDFFGVIIANLVSVDDFGDVAEMLVHASIPGQSSSVFSFNYPAGVSEGDYELWFFNSAYEELCEPMKVKVLKRENPLAAPDKKATLAVERISPSYQRAGTPCGVTITVRNSTPEEKTENLVLRVLTNDNLEEVMKISLDDVATLLPNAVTTVNVPPFEMTLGAGAYLWRVETADGTPLSNLQLLRVIGKEFTVGDLLFEPTDESGRKARLCAINNSEVESVYVNSEAEGYTVDAITPDVFCFSEALTKVTLPEGVVSLPSGAFHNATSLRFLNFGSRQPVALGNRVFSEDKIPSIVVSGPLAYTNLYAASDLWASFSYSGWNLDLSADVVIKDLLRDDSGNLYVPYFWQSDLPMTFNVDVPSGYAAHVEWTLGGNSHSYSTYGPVSLPETFGEMGTAKITLMPDAGVEGVESDRSPRDVFTPDGVRVLKDAMPEDISRLPKGIYLIGSRKIIIR